MLVEFKKNQLHPLVAKNVTPDARQNPGMIKILLDIAIDIEVWTTNRREIVVNLRRTCAARNIPGQTKLLTLRGARPHSPPFFHSSLCKKDSDSAYR